MSEIKNYYYFINRISSLLLTTMGQFRSNIMISSLLFQEGILQDWPLAFNARIILLLTGFYRSNNTTPKWLLLFFAHFLH